ncbi:MAG: hypothetical protein PHV42_04465 [Candidatus Pacebacteria bacterium]|nr:hypothetical protein [Candidatus Paceibacterota bacterium]
MSDLKREILKRLDENDTMAKTIAAEIYRKKDMKGFKEMQAVLKENSITRQHFLRGGSIKEGL